MNIYLSMFIADFVANLVAVPLFFWYDVNFGYTKKKYGGNKKCMSQN
jgi:hypothetical protein